MKVKSKRKGNHRRRIIRAIGREKELWEQRTGLKVLVTIARVIFFVSLLVIVFIGETVLIIYRFIIAILLPVSWGGVAVAVPIAFAAIILVTGIDAFAKGWLGFCLISYAFVSHIVLHKVPRANGTIEMLLYATASVLFGGGSLDERNSCSTTSSA